MTNDGQEKKCQTCGKGAKIRTAKDGRLRCIECFQKWFEQVNLCSQKIFLIPKSIYFIFRIFMRRSCIQKC